MLASYRLAAQIKGLKCAQSIVESDATCPICEHVITKSNIKLVNIEQDVSACKLSLCGQAPETAMASALSSINFYIQQQQLQADYKEAQLNKKVSKVQEACRKKLEEVHNGYQTAKRKYQEVLQSKQQLEQDNAELQQKYSQKAMQARKLQEMFKKLQQENDGLRRGSGKSLGGLSVGSGRSMSPIGQPGQMVTTVQRTQVFSTLPDLSPPNAALLGGGGPGTARVPNPQQAMRGGRPNMGHPMGNAGFMSNGNSPLMGITNNMQMQQQQVQARRANNMFGNPPQAQVGGDANTLRKMLGGGPVMGSGMMRGGPGGGKHDFGGFGGSPSGLVSM